jgi:hypothetical protein
VEEAGAPWVIPSDRLLLARSELEQLSGTSAVEPRASLSSLLSSCRLASGG